MMIKGTGIDIVKIERMQRAVSSKHFVERVFTEAEQRYCNAKKQQAVCSYAARFAAKEALVKALGTGFVAGKLLEIEVLNDPLGKPNLLVKGFFYQRITELEIKNIHLSLTHTAEYAVAQVILEG